MTGAATSFLRESLFNGNGLAKRLIVALVLFSSVITTVITTLELYGEYRRDVQQIDQSFNFIGKSYLPALTDSVWISDREQVQTQLAGLLQLPDLEYIGISVDGKLQWSAGKAVSTRTISSEIALVHEHRGQRLSIGTLQLVASVDRVLARIWDHLLLQLLGNGIKTLLVAGFLLLVFQWLVTRHLTTIAGFVRSLDPRATRGEQVKLARSETGRWRPDVLDAVTTALNGMSRSLQQAQRERRGTEMRLRALTEHASAFIFEIDRIGQITFANRTYPGLTRKQVEGTMLTNWFPPELRGQIEQSMTRAFASGEVQKLEYTIPNPAGQARSYVATIAPILSDGASLSATLTAVDITDQKAAEHAIRDMNLTLEQRVRERTAELHRSTERAEKASRAKSEFLSHMSHELRTPMNAILGFAQIIELAKPTDEQRRWAGEIRRAGDHLLEMIEELLDLSRIEVGRLAVRIEPVSVQQVIEEAVQIIEPLIRHSPLQLTIKAARVGDHAVLADRTRLRQVLVNLLSNAVKYNRAQGEISIDCSSADAQRLRIAVRDTGPGIAPEQLDSLFKPFERLGAERGAIEGTGIGLALSKQLAELMGGALGVESRPGEGSTFWIDLPKATAQGVGTDDTAPQMPLIGADTALALYVEDNPANLAVMQAFVSQISNLTLLTAVNAREGLELARQHRPQVILLDIHLPDGDGYEVLRRLKADEATRNIPVIALTADAMPADQERGRAAGFRAYLTKPVKFNELADTIEKVLLPTP